jgi:predicted Zn-dependent protease
MRNRAPQAFLLPLLLTAALVVIPAGCATNPVSGTPDLVFMSEATEIQIGAENDAKVRMQYGVYDNPELQAYVQRVGEKLAAQSHRPGLAYHFTVLDSPEVNAFALPGGYIYITRGILAYLNSEAELAAILGHEIGHVTARHAVRQYTTATATGFVGAFIGIATGIPVTQNMFNDIFGNAILSGYGRDHELEADRLGAEYIARSNYDPDAMIRVLGLLKNQEEFEKKRAAAENRAPRIYHGVFASHPSADKRLQEVVAEADKYKTLSTSITAREAFLKQTDHLLFGDTPKSGVPHGNHYYHRNLNFALSFPEGWAIEYNSYYIIRAVSRDKQAMLQVEPEKLVKELSPEEFLRTRMKASAPDQTNPIEGMTQPSSTGVVAESPAFGKYKTRVAVVYFNDQRFLFQGATKEGGVFAVNDPLFMAAIRSLHALTDKEKHLADGMHVRLVRARAGDTFAGLAKTAALDDYGESVLRLINDKFPDGEPSAGETIKTIE